MFVIDLGLQWWWNGELGLLMGLCRNLLGFKEQTKGFWNLLCIVGGIMSKKVSRSFVGDGGGESYHHRRWWPFIRMSFKVCWFFQLIVLLSFCSFYHFGLLPNYNIKIRFKIFVFNDTYTLTCHVNMPQAIYDMTDSIEGKWKKLRVQLFYWKN